MGGNNKKGIIEDLMLDALHGSLETLVERIKDKTISHQEMEVLRKLLSDNNINVRLSSTERGTNIIANLPFEVDDDLLRN